MHPDHPTVIPQAPEIILQQNIFRKNDCECKAGKRFLIDQRHKYPLLKVIVVEDGVGSNGPHLTRFMENNRRFILGT